MRLGFSRTVAAAAMAAASLPGTALAQMQAPPPMDRPMPPPPMPGPGGPYQGGQYPGGTYQGGTYQGGGYQGGGYQGGWNGPQYPAYPHGGNPNQQAMPEAYRAEFDARRADWLDECHANWGRRGYRHGNGGIIGALIGGVAGAVIGHEVAAVGDRAIGAVVGGGVGAVAGAVIGQATRHRGYRDNRGDFCENYLESHMSQQAYGPPPMMMVPMQVPSRKPCVETVTIREYISDGPRRRSIPPRPRRVIHDKRIPI